MIADNSCLMVTSSKPPSQAADPVMEPSMAQATGSLQNIVPACPQGLTITKGDFLKPDFTVDNFFIEVSVREGGASLDVLRDDLGIYLKVLRSSMIELINQDYADFVNLSTNLVGLDQGILKIREPLESLNTEITGAREELGSCLDKVRVKLARQQRIRQEKEMLASLQQVAANTVKVERMLGTGVRAELNTDTAERIATDINQLNFVLWKMKVTNESNLYYCMKTENNRKQKCNSTKKSQPTFSPSEHAVSWARIKICSA